MLADLDLLLISVYCRCDDLLPRGKGNARRTLTDPRRGGLPPRVRADRDAAGGGRARSRPRWAIEESFERAKGEVGLDQYGNLESATPLT